MNAARDALYEMPSRQIRQPTVRWLKLHHRWHKRPPAIQGKTGERDLRARRSCLVPVGNACLETLWIVPVGCVAENTLATLSGKSPQKRGWEAQSKVREALGFVHAPYFEALAGVFSSADACILISVRRAYLPHATFCQPVTQCKCRLTACIGYRTE